VGRASELLEPLVASLARYVLERIADHPINRIEELLPWNVAKQLPRCDLLPDHAVNAVRTGRLPLIRLWKPYSLPPE
jgi:hypothetical protein